MRVASYAISAMAMLVLCNAASASVIASAKDVAAAAAGLAKSATGTGDGKVTICVVVGETSDPAENVKKPRRCRNYVRDAGGRMVTTGQFYEKPPVFETYEPSVWTATSNLAAQLMEYVGSFMSGKPADDRGPSVPDHAPVDLDALVMSVDAGRAEALARAQSEPSSAGLRRNMAIMTEVAGGVERAGSDALMGAANDAAQQSVMALSNPAMPDVSRNSGGQTVARTVNVFPSQAVSPQPARPAPTNTDRGCWPCAGR